MPKVELKSSYRYVFVIESRKWWSAIREDYSPDHDLVLTFDFGLRQDIHRLGGSAHYVDHLVSPEDMQTANFVVYDFFRNWHKDAYGNDCFEFRGIPFGFALRIDIWNDLLTFVRIVQCLGRLRETNFETLFVGTDIKTLLAAVEQMRLTYSLVVAKGSNAGAVYYFPIFRWMREKTRRTSAKHRLADAFMAMQSHAMSWVDRVFKRGAGRIAVFIQEYYPTKQLVRRLVADPQFRLILANFSRAHPFARYIPLRALPTKYQAEARRLLADFRRRRSVLLVLPNGGDISEAAYRVIEECITERLPECLSELDCILDYLDRHLLDLEILIGNVGKVATLVDCVCRTRGIPSYLIVNGFLSGDFLDESKYATVINSYSESVKTHYFRGMDNIVCLGDPRMDDYALSSPRLDIDRRQPTVTIGASGFNPTDLNSYLAVEFEFLHGVLQSLLAHRKCGFSGRIRIKIRSNGYRSQYEAFVAEYFPGLRIEIIDDRPMRSVLEETDLYISIYSQTIFEASCLGIPSIYYKIDEEFLDPPFDGVSELVTVRTIDELSQAIVDFCDGSPRYGEFLERSTMEKYIGPLDGKNLERNFEYVRQFAEQQARNFFRP